MGLLRSILALGLPLLAGSLGFFVSQRPGAILAGGSIAFFLLFQACTGRWQLQKKTQAKPFFASETTLDLWIYPDIFPTALLIKPLGSSGSVFLSQGLTSILTQKELEELLHRCSLQLKHLGWSSFYQTLAFFFLNLLPSSVAGWLLLDPDTRSTQGKTLNLGETLLFFIFFPWIQGLLFLAQDRSKLSSSVAFQKIERRIQTWGILGADPLLALHGVHSKKRVCA